MDDGKPAGDAKSDADGSGEDSIFGATDPVTLLQSWLDEAAGVEPNDPNAMALATVDAEGVPNVRIVLLKQVDARGLVFFTNHNSDKGRELAQAGAAAGVIHWKSLLRQVRFRGPVSQIAAAESDAYYRSRPLDSRLGAWASRQSEPLASRDALIDAVEEARIRMGPDPVRPDHWGGWRIAPETYEFWADGAYRLHDRERWRRRTDGNGWTRARLYP